ncbi:unnamed protein product [Lasius platythorax]|uniref:Uncharacterized protein n=1 Tax=Lasius platythorax TaxID=488582 RepID=A0AAV2P9A3_9HYME
MFVERGLMDDEGAATVFVSVIRDNSCICRRCCRSSVAGHTIDKFGDLVGTIDCNVDDVIDDAVIVVDVGVRGGQFEPVSSFPSAPSPASPLLCLVCKQL